MPTLNLQRIVSSLMVLLVHLILLSVSAKGFQNHPVSYPSSMARARCGTTQMSDTNNSSNGDGGDWDDDASLPLPTSKPVTTSSQLEDGTFNPFNYQRNNKSSRSSGGGQVDLRSLRMSSLTNDLLNNLGNEAMMREILEDNRDFLLEPLEVEDSVAASASIYAPGMSRSERYQAYKNSVEERLRSSRNQQAKAVLTAMKDYVLEFENESPY